MNDPEGIWSTSLVMRERDAEGKEQIVAYSQSYVAESYEHAIGIALSVYKEAMEKGEKVLIAFDAEEQDLTDLEEMMKRKHWKKLKS